MAAIRNQPATCMDGEMRSVAFHSGIPVRIHNLETVWRRCTSATAFQRCLPSAWPQLLNPFTS
jgi:hypothetical protein